MESSFLNVCLSNGNNIVSMFNVLLLICSTVVLSISNDNITRIILSLIYLIIIGQYSVPIYTNKQEQDNENTKIGLYLISGSSVMLNLLLFNYSPSSKIFLYNILIYSIPSISSIGMS